MDNICLSANFQPSESMNNFWRLLASILLPSPCKRFFFSSQPCVNRRLDTVQTKVTCLVQFKNGRKWPRTTLYPEPNVTKTVTIKVTLTDDFGTLKNISPLSDWKLSNISFVLQSSTR